MEQPEQSVVNTHVPFFIIGVSIASTLIIEILGWLFVYRSSDYQRLKNEIEITSKKLEAIKETPAVDQDKKMQKEQQRLEKSMVFLTRDMYFSTIKVMVINVIVMGATYKFMMKNWGTMVVAKLPFEPINYVAKMSHRGLESKDMTDCAAVFIFFLSTMSIRGCISKFLGFGPSRGMRRTTSLQSSFNNFSNLSKEKAA